MKIKPKCVSKLDVAFTPCQVNLLKMKFCYKGTRNLGVRGCRSATQESLRSTVLKHTNKQSVERKGVRTAFPRVPTEIRH